MADKNIKVGLQMGVLGTGQLKSAFGQTRREVENLKGSTDRLGRANRAAADSTVSFATRGRLALAKLRGGYDGLTRSLGGLRMAAMAAAAIPVAMGVNKALSLQDLSVDLAMTAGLDAAFEKDFATLIQSSARSGNQTHDEAGVAAKLLVDGGVRDLQALGEYLPILTRNATASRVGIVDLTAAALALRDNLDLTATGFARSQSMLSYASSQGKMGVEALNQAMPGLSLRMKQLGVTGEAAVAELASALQIARGAATSDAEAQSNVDKFLERITSDATRKRFESAGISLEKSISNLTSHGMTPLEAMFETVTHYVGTRGPEALKAFNSALGEDDAGKREVAFAALSDRYALGDLFMDSGVQNFASAAMQNRKALADLKRETLAAANDDLIGADFIRRMGSAKEQMKGLGLALSDVGVTLSGPIVDGLLSAGLALLPMVQGAAAWVQQNPELVKSIVTVAGALLGARLALSGVGLVFKTGTWLVGGFTGAARMLGSVLSVLKSGLLLAGKALVWVGRALLMNPIGIAVTAIAGATYLIIKYWEPIKAFFKGLWDSVTGMFGRAWESISGFLGGMWTRISAAFDGGIAGISRLILDWSPLGLFYKAFAGVLGWFGVELPDNFSEFGSQVIDAFTSGITDVFSSAWQGVTTVFDGAWQGLTNAASSAWDGITSVTSSAWQSATGVFDSTWKSISGLFDGGIEGISKTIVDWSPLNLFQKGLDGVMDWFGVELPESFTGFGGMLVDGLTGGVTKAFTKAKETIINFGNSIKGWFSSVLDIKSPSRVFMELGGFVSEGAALGIRQQIPLAGRAVSELSGTIVDAGAGLAAPSAPVRAPTLGAAGNAPTTIHFSPVVHITAAPGSSIRDQSDQLMGEIKRGFGRLMQDYEYQQRRTAMAGAL